MKPNLDHINEIADGDFVFQQKMIDIVKKEFPLEKQGFLAYYNKEDYHKAAELVHKLKHKINIFGLVKGYEIAKLFEDELRNKQTTLYLEFDSILATIENYLKDI